MKASFIYAKGVTGGDVVVEIPKSGRPVSQSSANCIGGGAR